MEAAMFNPNDVIFQAKDKKRENVQWIGCNAILNKAENRKESRCEQSSWRMTSNAIEILKSLFLLKRPAHGHK
jgi:hypothetical protein